jgi:hypothetical protein
MAVAVAPVPLHLALIPSKTLEEPSASKMQRQQTIRNSTMNAMLLGPGLGKAPAPTVNWMTWNSMTQSWRSDNVLYLPTLTFHGRFPGDLREGQLFFQAHIRSFAPFLRLPGAQRDEQDPSVLLLVPAAEDGAGRAGNPIRWPASRSG